MGFPRIDEELQWGRGAGAVWTSPAGARQRVGTPAAAPRGVTVGQEGPDPVCDPVPERLDLGGWGSDPRRTRRPVVPTMSTMKSNPVVVTAATIESARQRTRLSSGRRGWSGSRAGTVHREEVPHTVQSD